MNNEVPHPQRIALSLSAIALLAVTTFALAGCTSTPRNSTPQTTIPATSTSVPAPAPPPQQQTAARSPSPSAQDRPLLICFGDSLTAGLGTDPGQTYPDDLQRLLDARHFNYHVLNAGISGDTTKDGLDRIARVLAHHPQIVVVEFGGNDGLRGLPLEQTQANLDSILHQLQTSGAHVALAGITLPPDYGPDYIKKFNAMYPALAKKYRIPFIPFLLKNVYGIPGDMQADNTHATAQGNKQVALNVEALLQPLLKH